MDLGVILGVAAILLTLAVERAKRPRLELQAPRWQAAHPVEWQFATVGVRNKPLRRPFSAVLTRQSAAGCTVWIEFRRVDRTELAIPRLPGRWSAHPEPIRLQPGGATIGGIKMVPMFDPSLVPPSYQLDVSPGDTSQEIAVAVLRSDGEAYGFTAESYQYPEWRNPAWKLEKGQYEVTVMAEASGSRAVRAFRLDHLAGSFADFYLSPE